MTELAHLELIYRGDQQLADGVGSFVRAGLQAGEPVFVAMPPHSLRVVRAALGDDAARVRFADMTQVGRNPNRIMPAIEAFIREHEGRRVRFVGEPIWAGRTEAEISEGARHEALINVAFAGAEASILCPYDASRLDGRVLADAERTHPVVLGDGDARPSHGWPGTEHCLASVERALPEPAAQATSVPITRDLAGLRRVVRAEGARSLEADRVDDLVLAVNEAATNTLLHGGAPGALRMWRESGSLVAEVRDNGRLSDPLAGRIEPPPEIPAGRGLWIINQLCDLVELRPRSTGTTLRMHFDAEA